MPHTMARSLAGWIVGSVSASAALVASLSATSCEQSIDVELRQCPTAMAVGDRGVVGFSLDAGDDVAQTTFRLEPADLAIVALVDDSEECTEITSADGQPDGAGDCTKRFPNRAVTVVAKGVGAVKVVVSATESDGDADEDVCSIFVRAAGTGGSGGVGGGGGTGGLNAGGGGTGATGTGGAGGAGTGGAGGAGTGGAGGAGTGGAGGAGGGSGGSSGGSGGAGGA